MYVKGIGKDAGGEEEEGKKKGEERAEILLYGKCKNNGKHVISPLPFWADRWGGTGRGREGA